MFLFYNIYIYIYIISLSLSLSLCSFTSHSTPTKAPQAGRPGPPGHAAGRNGCGAGGKRPRATMEPPEGQSRRKMGLQPILFGCQELLHENQHTFKIFKSSRSKYLDMLGIVFRI